ncbi:MAG: signal peptidase I, partial [Anaerolineaceae bacterium]|nr:signal peptidase I [Anaerolineaceae bacterium]
MRVYRRWINTFFAGTALVAAVLAWIVFAPVKMGGQAGYVIINGNSMEPGFHTGDMVVVREANEYAVGDAVIYWNVELKRFVFHRIIEGKLDRFVFQGDNNSWIDSYEPTREELIGKLWFSIPKVGKVVEWIRNPIIFGLTVGALGGILVAFLFKRSNKKKSDQPAEQQTDRLTRIKEWFLRTLSFKGRLGSQLQALSTRVKNGSNPASSAIHRVQNSNIRGLNSIIEACFFILGIVAIGSLVLGVFAFTNPINQTLTENLPYKHTGKYSYSAPAPVGVYDAPSVRSGDPIFPKLTCSINLQFSYLLAGEQLENLQGTHQLTALIRENTTGWTRTIPLEPSAVKFSGNAFESAITVNLCQIQSIVDTMEEQTGISQKNYSLVIDPKVEIAGTLSGIVLKTSFRPEMVFQFDKVQIYMGESLVLTGSVDVVVFTSDTSGGTICNGALSRSTVRSSQVLNAS